LWAGVLQSNGVVTADIQLTAEFAATEDLGKKEVNLGRQFDAVTCMFAIHYFFASKAAADNFFRNVSINLKQGGPPPPPPAFPTYTERSTLHQGVIIPTTTSSPNEGGGEIVVGRAVLP